MYQPQNYLNVYNPAALTRTHSRKISISPRNYHSNTHTLTALNSLFELPNLTHLSIPAHYFHKMNTKTAFKLKTLDLREHFPNNVFEYPVIHNLPASLKKLTLSTSNNRKFSTYTHT